MITASKRSVEHDLPPTVTSPTLLVDRDKCTDTVSVFATRALGQLRGCKDHVVDFYSGLGSFTRFGNFEDFFGDLVPHSGGESDLWDAQRCFKEAKIAEQWQPRSTTRRSRSYRRSLNLLCGAAQLYGGGSLALVYAVHETAIYSSSRTITVTQANIEGTSSGAPLSASVSHSGLRVVVTIRLPTTTTILTLTGGTQTHTLNWNVSSRPILLPSLPIFIEKSRKSDSVTAITSLNCAGRAVITQRIFDLPRYLRVQCK